MFTWMKPGGDICAFKAKTPGKQDFFPSARRKKRLANKLIFRFNSFASPVMIFNQIRLSTANFRLWSGPYGSLPNPTLGNHNPHIQFYYSVLVLDAFSFCGLSIMMRVLVTVKMTSSLHLGHWISTCVPSSDLNKRYPQTGHEA